MNPVTTAAPIRLVSAGLTDPGRVRGYNEDAFLDTPQSRLWVVADGMGGHAAGDVASGLIVERLSRLVLKEGAVDRMDAVDQELSEVNAELLRRAKQQNVALIGATVVVLMACPEFMVCGWAGDSRIYRYRDGKLTRITRDHSSVQEMVDSGQISAESAAEHPYANAITRAVGGDDKLFLDWAVAGCEAGTQFLMCTDGVTKELTDERIEAELARGLAPSEAVAAVVKAAVENGGRDNTTAIVVRVEGTA